MSAYDKGSPTIFLRLLMSYGLGLPHINLTHHKHDINPEIRKKRLKVYIDKQSGDGGRLSREARSARIVLAQLF